MLVKPTGEGQYYPDGTGESSSGNVATLGEQHEAATADIDLLEELRERAEAGEYGYSERIGADYLNKEVADLVRAEYTPAEIDALTQWLEQAGALTIKMVNTPLRIGDEEIDVSCMPATELDPNLGEMGEVMYWRDSYQKTRAWMQLYTQDRGRYETEGKIAQNELSGYLFAMSTPAQLARFDYVITHGQEAGQLDWPNITVRFSDIGAEEPFEWRHKQDSVAMLWDLTLEALQQRVIQPEDLHPNHKELLGRIVPFLESIGYPRYESSGSWEEVAAMSRTSVLSIETSLLERIHTLLQSDLAPRLDFLAEAYGQHLRRQSDGSLQAIVEHMMLDGLQTIGRQLPHESPDHDQPAIRQRKADATLVYTLMYRMPELLAKYQIPIGPKNQPMSQRKIEDLINDQLDTLYDPATGCMARYQGDSYQRLNWHTNKVKAGIARLKQQMKAAAVFAGRKEIDLDQKQTKRNEVVPSGRQAMWPHPMFQRAAWAARRSIEEATAGRHRAGRRYRRQSAHYVNQGLRAVTGENQYHAATANGSYIVTPTKSNRVPEAIITYADEQGQFLVASPHNPLHWAVASCKEALGLLGIATTRARTTRLGKLGLLKD
jgi:hypothetical protein